MFAEAARTASEMAGELLRQARRRAPVVALVAVLAVVGGVAFGHAAGSPADPAARFDEARQLVFDRQPAKALNLLRRGLAELGHGDAGAADPELARKMLVLAARTADFHLENGVAEALELYRSLFHDFPGTPEAYDAGVRIGEILTQRLGDAVHAEAQYVATVDAFPHQQGAEALLVRAARLAIDGRRYVEARAYAERLARDFSDSERVMEALSLVGVSHHLEGDHAKATQAFEAAAARAPNTPEGARALADAGNCLAEQGDFGRAIARYIDALPDHPDPGAVQHELERVRRKFSATRNVELGKAVAFSGRSAVGE